MAPLAAHGPPLSDWEASAPSQLTANPEPPPPRPQAEPELAPWDSGLRLQPSAVRLQRNVLEDSGWRETGGGGGGAAGKQEPGRGPLSICRARRAGGRQKQIQQD